MPAAHIPSPVAKPQSRYISPSRRALRTLIFTALCVASIVLVECLWPGWSFLLPAVLIPCYIARVLQLEQTAEDVIAAADHVYLLGYLGTIAALCAWGIRISRDSTLLEHSHSIAVVAGQSLVSTIIGLIAMATLRAHSRGLHRRGPESIRLEEAVDRLSVALSAVSLPTALHELVRHLQDAPKSLYDLRESSGQARDAICSLSHQLQEATEQANQFLEMLAKNLAKTSDESQLTIRLLTGQLQRVTAEANEYVTTLAKPLRNVTQEICGFGQGIEEARSRIRVLVESVKQVEQVLDAFVHLVNLKLEQDLAQIERRR